MADVVRKSRKMKDLVEDSKYWAASDLIRNLDEEMERAEQGFIHMIWGIDDKPVTRMLRPLPIAPKFRTSETGRDVGLKTKGIDRSWKFGRMMNMQSGYRPVATGAGMRSATHRNSEQPHTAA